MHSCPLAQAETDLNTMPVLYLKKLLFLGVDASGVRMPFSGKHWLAQHL